MLMAYPLHWPVLLVSMCGPMHQDSVVTVIILTSIVLALLYPDQILPLLSVNIITVSLAIRGVTHMILTTPKNHYGMEPVVPLMIIVVLMPTHHGSIENFSQHKEKILKSGSALIKRLLMKVF